MRYREGTDLVLRGVDLVVPGGTKVGIVGRTGSGKSSLYQVLFRMVEAEGGEVVIDEINTRRVGLGTIRSTLTIIPQVGHIRLVSFAAYTLKGTSPI